MKKHYLLIEYSVRVLIGPADIRFELWFDDQKLSRDQSIKVEWTPSRAPSRGLTPAKNPEDYLVTHGRAELADAPPTPMSGALMGKFTGGNGKIERTGTAIVMKDAGLNGEDKKKRGMGGFMARAKGGKWSVRG